MISVKGAEKKWAGEAVLGIRVRKCHRQQIMQVEEGKMSVDLNFEWTI